MKKLSLKPNAFDKGEVLTRAQLKIVMGGSGSYLTGSGDRCNSNPCSFEYRPGIIYEGICGASDNGTQCRCIHIGDGGSFPSASVPDSSCVA